MAIDPSATQSAPAATQDMTSPSPDGRPVPGAPKVKKHWGEGPVLTCETPAPATGKVFTAIEEALVVGPS